MWATLLSLVVHVAEVYPTGTPLAFQCRGRSFGSVANQRVSYDDKNGALHFHPEHELKCLDHDRESDIHWFKI